MKYIVGALVSVLILGLVACGSDNEGAPGYNRTAILYADGFNMYKGAVPEAVKVKLDTVPRWNSDSLYRMMTNNKYLSKFGDNDDFNKISFEFLEGGMMVFADQTKGYKVLSTYLHRNDSLFVLKNGTQEVFVAVKEKNGNSYYRTRSIMRKMLWAADPTKPVDDTMSVSGKLIDVELALKFAEFESLANMNKSRDTVVWCNVKYIYE